MKAEREFVDQALDALEDVFYVVGTDGRMRRWNDRFEAVTGYDGDEISEMDVVDFFAADDRLRVEDAVREVLTTGEAAVEADFLTADGERIPHEFTGARLTDPDGELLGFAGEPLAVSGVFRPVVDEAGTIDSLLITDRDVTERTVRETQLETILENTDTPMFLKDTDGEYLLVNDAFVDLFDRPRDDILGRTADELLPGPVADRIAANDRAVLESGEAVEVEESLTADGAKRVYLTAKGPVYDTGLDADDERPVGVFGVATEITERKRRERELERQNRRFDELADVVSHDLQAPIAAARGRMELALESGESEHVAEALDALERVDDLRADVVDLLRSRQIVGERERVDATRLAESAWKSVAAPDDASVDAVEPAAVDADPDALRRLLQNLLANSVEHGPRAVSVRVGGLEDGFYVEDDGPGIPPDERDHVFSPGFTTKPEGNGMGMSSVRQIVRAHDWEIEVGEGQTLDGVRFEITERDDRREECAGS